jgi:hypothetical protein
LDDRPLPGSGSAAPFVAVLAVFATVGVGVHAGWKWSPTLPSLPSASYSLKLPAEPGVEMVAPGSVTPIAEVRRADRIDAPIPPPSVVGEIILVPSAPTQMPAAATAPPGRPDQPDTTPAVGAQIRIGHTGGVGAFVRRTPRLADRLVAWPDATVLEALGETAEGDGLLWIKVRDPGGNLGWIPAAYVLP